MTTHSSILAQTILQTEEPGGLPSIGLQTVQVDRSDLAHTSTQLEQELSDVFSRLLLKIIGHICVHPCLVTSVVSDSL